MKTATALCLFLLLSLSAADAKADAVVILPNGEYGFNTTFSAQGVFQCAPGVPCSGSGTNSVTLGSGANTLTITFTGTSGTRIIGAESMPITLGRFEMTTTGSGFTFPTLANPNLAILGFDFSITHTSPVAATRVLHWDFGPGGSTVLPPRVFDRHMPFPTGPNPPGYTFIFYDFLPFSLPGTDGGLDLNARVNVIPEPATLLLLGTGLAGAAFARRRRRGES